MKFLIEKRKKSHSSIVRGLQVNYRLDVIISFDIENLISITCINNFVTLFMYNLDNEIVNIKISNYDILYIQTKNENSDSILSCYTLNGLKSNELIVKKPNQIIDYFVDIINDNVLIGTNESLRFVECYDPNKIIIDIKKEENENKNNEKVIINKINSEKEIIKKEDKKDEEKENIKEEEKEKKKDKEKEIIKEEEKEEEKEEKNKEVKEIIKEEEVEKENKEIKEIINEEEKENKEIKEIINEEEKGEENETIEGKDEKKVEIKNKEIKDENKTENEIQNKDKTQEKPKEKIQLLHLTYLYKLNCYCYINGKNKLIVNRKNPNNKIKNKIKKKLNI